MTNAERQKAYRGRKRNAVTPETVTVPVTLRVPRNAETVTALRSRVTELEEEVARLKRELAEANRLEPMTSGLSPEAHLREVLKRRGAKPDNDKHVTPHGMRCMCQWCQQQRRVAGWEGA